jgi:hypothetical protein
MKTASCKAKGQSLQNDVCRAIGLRLAMKYGKDTLIAPRPSGQSGADVILTGDARTLCPVAFECKKAKRFNLASIIEQSEEHLKHNPDFDYWVAVLERSGRGIKPFGPVVVLDASVFFDLILGRAKIVRRTKK